MESGNLAGVMRPARTAARSLLPIALVASALATTGCDPVMEVYLSPGEDLGVSNFGVFDELHAVIFLRGGDQDTRIRFRFGPRGTNGDIAPGTSRPYSVDRFVFPRPSADQLGAEVTLDVQLVGPPVMGAQSTEPTEAGPWDPGDYEIQVVMDNAATGEEIQVEDIDFAIQ